MIRPEDAQLHQPSSTSRSWAETNYWGFRIHGPDMDPLAGEAWGDAYNGHFDQTGVFTGVVTLRGQRMPFECVSTWDHSWGIRPERHRSSLSWLHAHFSENYAIHAMLAYD